jgi:hypothetical protein
MAEAMHDMGGQQWALWCPACDEAHVIGTGQGGWIFDGDLARPTIHPSILVTGAQWPEGSPFRKPAHAGHAGSRTVCHSFVRHGEWSYLADCTHTLAGQSVPVVPWPIATEATTGEAGQ